MGASSATEDAATYEERRRALGYILACESGRSLLELIHFESIGDNVRRWLYMATTSFYYRAFIFCIMLCHLAIAIAEAPGGRFGLGRGPVNPDTNLRCPYNRETQAELFKANCNDPEDQLTITLSCTVMFILLQVVDIALELFLFGTRKAATLNEFSESTGRAISGISVTPGGFGPRAKSTRSRLGSTRVASAARKKGKLRTMLFVRACLLAVVCFDWVIQAITRYRIVNTDKAVLLLPVTSFVRPLLMMFRFRGILLVSRNVLKTLFKAVDVLALFGVLWAVMAAFGMLILRDIDSLRNNFETIPDALGATFTYLTNGENFPELLWGATTCTPTLTQNSTALSGIALMQAIAAGGADAVDGLDAAAAAGEDPTPYNTRLGGVMHNQCAPVFLHIPLFFFGMLGLFMVISLLVSVFDGVFGKRTQRVAMSERKRRRMGIIAAFILLDKDRSGFLDKTELIDFLNGTAGITRRFDIEDDFTMSGIEFVELCE